MAQLKQGDIAQLLPPTTPHSFVEVIEVLTWDGATDVLYRDANGQTALVIRSAKSRVAVKER